MFYIRFLSVPKVSSPSTHRRRTVKFVLTVTTDLGDAFFASEARLRATARTEAGATIAAQTLLWRANARALPSELSFEHTGPVPPLRIWVTAEHGDSNTGLDGGRLPSLVGVFSAGLDWPNSAADTRVERRFTLGPRTTQVLRQWEDIGDNIARHVWDGGLALAACLTQLAQLNDSSPVFGKALAQYLHTTQEPQAVRVIELGAGCGTAGIALAQLFPQMHVLLTDLPDAMDILFCNIQAACLAKGSIVDVAVLDWDAEERSEILERQFDLIVVSECTYSSDSIPALVRTIATLTATSPTAMVLLSTKVRHESEAVFFDLTTAAGMERIDQTAIQLPPNPNAWQLSDQVDIHLFRRPLRSKGPLVSG